MRRRTVVIGLGAILLLAAAGVSTGAGKQPDRVVVQHVLISFKGRIQGKEIARTKKQAEALAQQLFDRARAGEDFDALVREYTDDRYPGVYKMSNRGQTAPPGGYARDKMAASFGDVAFVLEVGEVGMARYHAELSPFGWHVIKRLE